MPYTSTTIITWLINDFSILLIIIDYYLRISRHKDNYFVLTFLLEKQTINLVCVLFLFLRGEKLDSDLFLTEKKSLVRALKSFSGISDKKKRRAYKSN